MSRERAQFPGLFRRSGRSTGRRRCRSALSLRVFDSLEERRLLSGVLEGTTASPAVDYGPHSHPVGAPVLFRSAARATGPLKRPPGPGPAMSSLLAEAASRFASEIQSLEVTRPEATLWIERVSYEFEAPPVPAENLMTLLPRLHEPLGLHDTFETAMSIDSAESSPVMVSGTLRDGDSPDMFRLPGIDGGFTVQIIDTNKGTGLDNYVWVYDAQGTLLGGWSLPAHTPRMTIEITSSSDAPGPGWYLGIGIEDGANSGETIEDSYALLVTPVPAGSDAGSSPDLSGDSPSTPLSDPGPTSGPVNTGPPSSPSGDEASSVTSSPGGAQAEFFDDDGSLPSQMVEPENHPVALATPGPLPARLASAFGGVLEIGEEAPETHLADASPVRSRLHDASPEETPSEEATGPELHLPDVAALLGPGGVPLLSALQVRGYQDEGPREVTPARLEMEALLAEIAAEQAVAQCTADTAENREPVPTPLGKSRAFAVGMGLSLFATMTASLVGPELARRRPATRGRSRLARFARLFDPRRDRGIDGTTPDPR